MIRYMNTVSLITIIKVRERCSVNRDRTRVRQLGSSGHLTTLSDDDREVWSIGLVSLDFSDRSDNVCAIDHLAKYDVLVVKMWRRFKGDEPL